MDQFEKPKPTPEYLLSSPEVDIKQFAELSNIQLLSLLALRYDVFVREQRSIFDEYDGHDTAATHLLIEDKDQVVAYARAYQETPDTAVIGRVAVAQEYRGQGLARQVVAQAIAAVRNMDGVQNINIAAQTYLQPFYESFGFVPTSEPYDDEGVLHTKMSLSLQQK